MFNLPLGESNDLCPDETTSARRRRDVGNETTDATPVVEDTATMFPINTLLRILNLTTTRIAVRLVREGKSRGDREKEEGKERTR